MHKKWLYAESLGLLFTMTGFWLMRQLYHLTHYGLSGVLFGCVNHSVWESAKALLLPYLVWAGIELLCLGKSMRHLCVAKTAALWCIVIVFSGLSLLTAQTGIPLAASDWLCAGAATVAATAVSLWLTVTGLPCVQWFPVALCLLFLLLACYFSFTPFPPHHALFADRLSGQYGIPPIGYDFGADVL